MAEYIDRTALGIGYADPKAFINPAHANGWNTAIQIINEAPSADVAPVRHAKWVLIDECVNEGVYCSNCHKKIYRAEYANQKVKSNFCPNCGAKMDGKDGESDENKG